MKQVAETGPSHTQWGRAHAVSAVCTGGMATAGDRGSRFRDRQSMTSKELETILPEIVQRLVAALQPEQIYLFGSHARAEAQACSDVDILVVVADSAEPGHRRDRAAYHALWGLAVTMDVLVWTRDEFERGLRLRTSLSSSVQRTGRLLYAA